MPARKPQQFAVVRIGYRPYLLPAANAAKLIEILSSAFECEEHYGDGGKEYSLGGPIDLEYAVVRPSQVRHSEEAVRDERFRHPRRLTKHAGVAGLLPAPTESLWSKVKP